MTEAGERLGEAAAKRRGELVDRVDLLDQVMAVTSRADAVRHGWLHRIVAVVCRDESGRILLVRRSPRHPRFPGRLEAFVAGAVKAGESYEEAAAREVLEELGVRVAARRVDRFLNLDSPTPHWMGLYECQVPATSIVADDREIVQVSWHSVGAARTLCAAGVLTPESRPVLCRITG
ncbi:NUDIX domain-containing protein [Streptomyces panaciradicis]|uniref:NUDIX domain-containing protein n=1 Tax=Streptomyces panaciradicis TaxID=1470261 RepID=UPI00201D0438|nr:NUDIX hydrolase [Streptomyces panaciradicis]MCL6673365.1 NUDIX hydrolase [Streptomyces panaciradicis]